MQPGSASTAFTQMSNLPICNGHNTLSEINATERFGFSRAATDVTDFKHKTC